MDNIALHVKENEKDETVQIKLNEKERGRTRMTLFQCKEPGCDRIVSFWEMLEDKLKNQKDKLLIWGCHVNSKILGSDLWECK